MKAKKRSLKVKSRARPPAGSAEQILTAALAEFAEHGLAGARVDRIAALSGVNKAMIYYHFGSKENLYDQCIKQVMNRIVGFFEEAATTEPDPEEFVRKVTVFYHSLFDRAGDFRPIFLRELASGSERLKAAFTATFSDRGLQKKMKALIDKGKRSGMFRNVDTIQAIISFIGMNVFYLIAAPVINDVWEIKDEKKFKKKRQKEVADLFLYGLKAR
ncbi:MAG: TetR/AcrR family transcriptional regulator [Candidatus Zixiibacteriota bacterium]|nr:MAG: TetR/AcrR family transcriptional regulator [candidate division Zixibacteria bacterium]